VPRRSTLYRLTNGGKPPLRKDPANRYVRRRDQSNNKSRADLGLQCANDTAAFHKEKIGPSLRTRLSRSETSQ
jgi:hypothetical protein